MVLKPINGLAVEFTLGKLGKLLTQWLETLLNHEEQTTTPS